MYICMYVCTSIFCERQWPHGASALTRMRSTRHTGVKNYLSNGKVRWLATGQQQTRTAQCRRKIAPKKKKKKNQKMLEQITTKKAKTKNDERAGRSCFSLSGAHALGSCVSARARTVLCCRKAAVCLLCLMKNAPQPQVSRETDCISAMHRSYIMHACSNEPNLFTDCHMYSCVHEKGLEITAVKVVCACACATQ